MGKRRLVIDGNSVYEIDLDCVKRHHPASTCEVYEDLEYMDAKGILHTRTEDRDKKK